jgi:hypothetical protein
VIRPPTPRRADPDRRALSAGSAEDRGRLIALAVTLFALGGCVHVARPPAAAKTTPPGEATRIAFAVSARVETGEMHRRLKLRVFAEAPDRIRVEGSGVVGGLAVIATGRGGRMRIVVPSRRRYSDLAVSDDLGTGLLGVPVTGCDLAALVRAWAGMAAFKACGDAGEEDSVPLDPNLDSNRGSNPGDGEKTAIEMLHLSVEVQWAKPRGRLPVSAVMMGGVNPELTGPPPPLRSVEFSGFREIQFPETVQEGFFWEPLPERATQVPAASLGAEPDA